MESLIIKEGKNTPLIHFDLDNLYFKIYGRSFPENAKKHYQPIIDWLTQLNVPSGNVTVEFTMYYISSSSMISILEMIKKFNRMNSDKVKISILWNYEVDDDDILKIGEDFKNVCSSKFELIANEIS